MVDCHEPSRTSVGCGALGTNVNGQTDQIRREAEGGRRITMGNHGRRGWWQQLRTVSTKGEGAMQRPLIPLLSAAVLSAAVLSAALAAPASAADDHGKTFAEGTFHSGGAGGFIVAAGTGAQATPIQIPAADHQDGVRIFGYAGGPSQDQVFCGDVWNVIVTAAFSAPEDKWLFDGLFTSHYLDGDQVGATSETAVKANHGFLDSRAWVQIFGTFLAPGTLDDGTHTVKQVLEHEQFGVFWAPPPLVFEVNDSAC